jgi:hypothetical protein
MNNSIDADRKAASRQELDELKAKVSPCLLYQLFPGIVKDSTDKFRIHCPFHDDSRPSLRLDRKPYGYAGYCDVCFGKGDILALIQAVHRCDFPQAKQMLKDGTGSSDYIPPAVISDKPKPPFAAAKAANNLVEWQAALEEHISSLDDPFGEGPRTAAEFLITRSVGFDTARKLGFGYASWCDSLAMPSYADGKLIGVKFRSVGEVHKDDRWDQLPAAETDILFGAHLESDPFAVIAGESTVLVFESQLDTAMVLSMGFNAVGLHSKRLPTTERFKSDVATVRRNYSRVILIGDRDNAGREAMEGLAKVFGDMAYIRPLPEPTKSDDKDIGDYYRTDPEKTKQWLLSTIAEVESLPTPENDPFADDIDDAWPSDVSDTPVARPQAAEREETLAEIRTRTATGYPLEMYDGTEVQTYMEMCGRNNVISREYFAEALDTIDGAVLGSTLSMYGRSIEPRLYTFITGQQGKGKSSATGWTLALYTTDLLFKTKPDVPTYTNIGALQTGFGSGIGLKEEFHKHNRILLFADEARNVLDKLNSPTSGGELMGDLLGLYEGTTTTPNATKGRKLAPTEAHLSILVNTTTEHYEGAFAGTGSTASGLFSRINLVASGNTEDTTEFIDVDRTPEFSEYKDKHCDRLRRMEQEPVEAIRNPGAMQILSDWQQRFKQSTKDDSSDITTRISELMLRKAMLLAWRLDRPAEGLTGTPGRKHVVIDADIMIRACKWADYQLKARRENRPLVGENPYAETEERILRHVQKNRGEAIRSEVYQKINGARHGLKTFNHAVRSLVENGMLKEEERQTKGGGRKGIWLVYIPEEER